MLQVRDITKRFGDVLVLDRINFNLNRGERAGLIGPNGCGKTTLLRIVTGEIAARPRHRATRSGFSARRLSSPGFGLAGRRDGWRCIAARPRASARQPKGAWPAWPKPWLLRKATRLGGGPGRVRSRFGRISGSGRRTSEGGRRRGPRRVWGWPTSTRTALSGH